MPNWTPNGSAHGIGSDCKSFSPHRAPFPAAPVSPPVVPHHVPRDAYGLRGNVAGASLQVVVGIIRIAWCRFLHQAIRLGATNTGSLPAAPLPFRLPIRRLFREQRLS